MSRLLQLDRAFTVPFAAAAISLPRHSSETGSARIAGLLRLETPWLLLLLHPLHQRPQSRLHVLGRSTMAPSVPGEDPLKIVVEQPR